MGSRLGKRSSRLWGRCVGCQSARDGWGRQELGLLEVRSDPDPSVREETKRVGTRMKEGWRREREAGKETKEQGSTVEPDVRVKGGRTRSRPPGTSWRTSLASTTSRSGSFCGTRRRIRRKATFASRIMASGAALRRSSRRASRSWSS